MKTILTRVCALLLISSSVAVNFGCTKEKAEAVKTAAEQFRVEADKALDITSSLVKGSVLTPPQDKEAELRKLVRELEAGSTVAQVQSTITGATQRYKVSLPAARTIDTEFGKMLNEYVVFASMFENLPRGHLFSKDAVAKAERHAIRLTLRFIKMADEIDQRPITFDSQHNQLVVDLMAAKVITDLTQRTQAIQIVAQKVIDLREAEKLANEQAIIQYLRAAEAGKTIVDLIRNYSRMSVGDMVNIVSESLGVINAITGDSNPKLKALIGKYNGFVDSKVKSDPLWKEVWNTEVGSSGE